jgi:hypothetical protein
MAGNPYAQYVVSTGIGIAKSSEEILTQMVLKVSI